MAVFEFEHEGEDYVIRLRPPLKSLAPEAREHFIHAQKELLLSARGFLDALIELADAAVQDKPSARKRTRIKVD